MSKTKHETQKIWVIGSSVPIMHVSYPLNVQKNGSIFSIALSKTHVYFAIKDQIGSFKISTSATEIIDEITFEPAKNIVQVVCGNEYVAYLTSSGEIYARGLPFPSTFTKIKNKKESEMPPAISISGTPYCIFAILSLGRFCIITGNSVIYRSKRHTFVTWYISSTMFLGTVLLLGHNGRAYTMSFNENNPTLSNTLQVFSEDPCVFTSLYSCHESLFFLTTHDYVVSYGYNHHGCLGVGHENTVSTLLRYRPPMNNEFISEIAPSSDFTFFLTHNGNLYVSGQSPYDKSCSSHPVLFQPLEGKRITQIRTYNNICIALEGGHRDYNSTSTPPHKYKQFPIVTIPTCYTGVLGGPLQIRPFPNDYIKSWYHPGDIVRKKDTKGKVIGLSNSNQPIIVVSTFKRVMALEPETEQQKPSKTDNEFVDSLVKRPGHNMYNGLISTKNHQNKFLYIDTTDSLITQFGGFHFADVVETKKGVRGIILGVRGEFIWIKPMNQLCFENYLPNELTLIERNPENLTKPFDDIIKQYNSETKDDLRIKPFAFVDSTSIWGTPIKSELDNDINDDSLFLPFNYEMPNDIVVHNKTSVISSDEVIIDEEKKPECKLSLHGCRLEDLYMIQELGLCNLIGYTDYGEFIYRRINQSQAELHTKVLGECVRRRVSIDNKSRQIVNRYNSPEDCMLLLNDSTVLTDVLTDYQQTIEFGVLAYDRIMTPEGLATVIGVHSGQIVAITDRNYVSSTLASLFSPEEVEIVARVDTQPFIKKFKRASTSDSNQTSDSNEIELLVNVSAFIDQPFIVQDRIVLKENDGTLSKGFVVGIEQNNESNNQVYVMMDDEDFVKPLTTRYKLIARYLHIMATHIQYDGIDEKRTMVSQSFMNAAGTLLKPGDVIEHAKTSNESVVYGFSSSEEIILAPLHIPEACIVHFKFTEITYGDIHPDIPPIRPILNPLKRP